MMHRFPSILACVGLTACAIPPPTPAQMAAALDRHYDVNPVVFQEAVNRVFSASRPGKYKVENTEGKIIAVHTWTRFALITIVGGSDTWEITYIPKNGGVIAIARETGATGDLVPIVSLTPPHQLANYELFWARVDYVLGKRPDWITCIVFQKMMIAGYPEDAHESLCGMDTTEAVPTRINPG